MTMHTKQKSGWRGKEVSLSVPRQAQYYARRFNMQEHMKGWALPLPPMLLSNNGNDLEHLAKPLTLKPDE